MTDTHELEAQARKLLPLTDAVFHILLSLAEGPAHGYAILQEVDARSDGAVRMGTGTLYSAVKRLRAQGLIEEAATDDPEGRRRSYALTRLGRLVLREEARRLSALVDVARRKAVLEGGLE